MNEGLDPCLTALREAKKRLKEEYEVTSLLDEEERRLVVPVLGSDLNLIYNAVCVSDDRVRVLSIVKGVWELINELSTDAKLGILRRLLQIPAQFKVAISIDSDGDLLFEPWTSSINEVSDEEVCDSFMLSIIFAKWLMDQLRNAREGKPIEEFRLGRG